VLNPRNRFIPTCQRGPSRRLGSARGGSSGLKWNSANGDNVTVNVLVIDIGGTHVKLLATGRKIRVEIPSGPAMAAAKMVQDVKKFTRGWNYNAVSIGYPGPVVHNQPIAEPHNLGETGSASIPRRRSGAQCGLSMTRPCERSEVMRGPHALPRSGYGTRFRDDCRRYR
jgi:hypothetical protein